MTEQTHHIIIPSYSAWFDYNWWARLLPVAPPTLLSSTLPSPPLLLLSLLPRAPRLSSSSLFFSSHHLFCSAAPPSLTFFFAQLLLLLMRQSFCVSAFMRSRGELCQSSSTGRTNPKPQRCEFFVFFSLAFSQLKVCFLLTTFHLLPTPCLYQILGLPQLHDRHVPPQPAGVPHLHLLPQEPDRGRVRHHEVSPAACCWSDRWR